VTTLLAARWRALVDFGAEVRGRIRCWWAHPRPRQAKVIAGTVWWYECSVCDRMWGEP